MARPSPLPLIVLIACAAVLGLAPILVRLTDTGPAAAGFWRMLFALPLLWLLIARAGGEGGVGRPSKWMIVAGLFFVLDLSVWHYSIIMTSVANATVLCNLTPVVVTLFAWIFFKETPKRLFLLALGLALSGAWTMAAGADGQQGTSPRLGDLFALSVSLWYGGYFLAVKAARATAGALRIMLWSTATACPLLLLVSFGLGEDWIPASLAGWAACAGLGLMHVAGQGGVAWALGRLPAAITAVVVLIQPVVAAGLGWAVFGESMTLVQGLGGVLVLTGVVLAQRSGVRTATSAAAGAAAPAASRSLGANPREASD